MPGLDTNVNDDLSPRRQNPRVFRVLPLVFVIFAGFAIGACSEDAQTDFSVDNESGFMAACTKPVEDSRLVSGICQCVFEQTEAQIEFSEFSATDELLSDSPTLDLPQQITDIIADCVIEEAEL